MTTLPTKVWWTAGVVALLALVPVLFPGYHTSLATLTLIYALLAMSVDILAGFAGRTPLCHGAIFGAATYVVMYYVTAAGGNPWVGVALGIFAALLVSLVFALLAVWSARLATALSWGDRGRVLWLGFTGAALPEGADAVVMVEFTAETMPGTIEVTRPVAPGSGLVRADEDAAAGDVLIRSGRPLRAPHLGLLAAAGVTAVAVHARPRVAIVSTGDEVVPPETTTLAVGQVRDATASALPG